MKKLGHGKTCSEALRIGSFVVLFFSAQGYMGVLESASGQHPSPMVEGGVKVGEKTELHLSSPMFTPKSPSHGSVLVWKEKIVYPGATYISPRFSSFALPPGAFLEVKAPDGSRRRRYIHNGKALSAEEGFWGIHIRGEAAILELHSSVALPKGAVEIDAFARGFGESSVPIARSVCKEDNSEWAPCFRESEPEIYDRSRAVARLLINGTRACTGWLIGTKGHLITNWHCVPSRSAAANTDFEFMAEGADCEEACDEAGACPGVVEADSAVIISANPNLDFVLLRLPVNVSDKYGHLEVRREAVEEGERVYMPQHGQFWGKQISVMSDEGFVEIVKVEAPSFEDCPGEGPDLAHTADTEGGSSGSPILAYSDHRVVGLNHCSGTCPENLAVPIRAILEDLGNIAQGGDIQEPPGLADEWDPEDDIPGRATVLPQAETFEKQHGLHTLSGTDIHDWFAVELVANISANFNSFGGTGDLVGELYADAEGEILIARNDNAGDGRQFSLTFTPPVTQTYYLKVMALSVGRTGTYQLSYSQDLPPITVRVNSSSDDAEEELRTGKARFAKSTDLELGEEGGEAQIVGIRFPSVDVPEDATIVNAHIQFTTDEVKQERTSLTIYGETSPHSAEFTRNERDLSSRERTSSSIAWRPKPWLRIGEQSLHQRTPNLADLLREIRKLEGWKSGHPMTFLIEGTGSRTATSFDGSPDQAPLLLIGLSSDPRLPSNKAPNVDLGEDIATSFVHPLELMPFVRDDGLPESPGELTFEWTQEGGPQAAIFSDPFMVNPTVRFPSTGIYTFRLSASDGRLSASDRLLVRVDVDLRTPESMTWLVDEHFETVQEAIDTEVVLGRDRILLPPGTFDPFIVPGSRPNLTISGSLGADGALATHIDANGEIGIHVLGPGTVLENLLVTGGRHGIFLEETRVVSILGCAVEDHRDTGISVVDASRTTILGSSVVRSSDRGISVSARSVDTVIFQTTFMDNEGHAIFVNSSSNLLVAENEFVGQGRDDIFLDLITTDVRIHDNRFHGGSRFYIQNQNSRAATDATCNIFPFPGVGREDFLGPIAWQPFRANEEGLCALEGTTFTLSIRRSSDDAEENTVTGVVSLRSTDLELGRVTDPQLVALRFHQVPIPPDTQILAATVQFSVDEESRGSNELVIFGEASDHSEPLTIEPFNISSRPRTEAQVDWDPDDWPTAGRTGSKQRTPHLVPIFQEIVDRPGWKKGNSITLIVRSETSVEGARVAESVDGARKDHGDLNLAPMLVVEYLSAPQTSREEAF